MANHATTVYIVEDDDTLRNDFVRAVGGSPQLELLGTTDSAQQALRYLETAPPLDVLLVDLGLPDGDGTDVIQALARHAPQAAALVISVFADDVRVMDALAAGARGYLLKDTTDDDLVRAIIDVANGDAPLAPQVARHLLKMFDPASAQAHTGASGRTRWWQRSGRSTIPLTPREAEILTLISQGRTGLEVSATLGLSLHTVNTHLRNCHAKLSTKNRVQAVNRARESGQIG